MVIYTHVNVDLDAVCSVWAARNFIRGAKYARLEFRPANWDGEGMGPDDMAVDIAAGGRGIKGEREQDGTTHSCFATLVRMYETSSEKGALAHIVAFVDAQDAYGSAVNYLLPDANRKSRSIFATTGLNAVLRAFQTVYPGKDHVVVHKFADILDGLLRNGCSRQRAEHEADKAKIVGDKVAIVFNNREYATNGVLFERGMRVVVFVDGHNLGLIRHSDERLRMDHVKIQEVVEEYNETSEWFAHPQGFLFARGTRKSPMKTPSKVDPHRLAEAALKALT